ncbi:shugoshin 2 [Porphyrio hochstetteri]
MAVGRQEGLGRSRGGRGEGLPVGSTGRPYPQTAALFLGAESRFILMMDKQATARSSTIFTLGVVKGQMKKRDGTFPAAKWNASLASKIKTKLMNNSSMFKVSLKQNNKALAVALSAEKENSRKLKNEKIFLKKEVEKLQLHNILLHQKLSCLNLQSFLPLSADPSSSSDDQFKSTCQSARSEELPVKLPLITTGM